LAPEDHQERQDASARRHLSVRPDPGSALRHRASGVGDRDQDRALAPRSPDARLRWLYAAFLPGNRAAILRAARAISPISVGRTTSVSRTEWPESRTKATSSVRAAVEYEMPLASAAPEMP